MSLKIIACINADGMLAGFRPPRDDLQRFAALTIGGVVIMGRKTWESLPDRMRPLPNRHNVVVTRNPMIAIGSPDLRGDHVDAYTDLDAAITDRADERDVWVIGGGEVYAQAMPRAELVYLSQTADTGGSVPFPLAAMNRFERLVEQQHASHRFSIWRARS